MSHGSEGLCHRSRHLHHLQALHFILRRCKNDCSDVEAQQRWYPPRRRSAGEPEALSCRSHRQNDRPPSCHIGGRSRVASARRSVGRPFEVPALSPACARESRQTAAVRPRWPTTTQKAKTDSKALFVYSAWMASLMRRPTSRPLHRSCSNLRTRWRYSERPVPSSTVTLSCDS